MPADYTYLKDQYPPIISAEQLYKICHISKRKAKWLLENGVIPCEDTGKRTHRFTIRLEDTVTYLQNKEQTSAVPAGIFSSKQKSKIIYPATPALPLEKLEMYLQLYWRGEPDALTVAQANQLTGYTEQTIRRWIQKGQLTAISYWP